MRTTITLDDDVAAKLKEELRRRDGGMKELVNELLRLALSTRREIASSKPFKVRAKSMGLRPGINLDNIGELLDQIEGPLHK